MPLHACVGYLEIKSNIVMSSNSNPEERGCRILDKILAITCISKMGILTRYNVFKITILL